MRARQLKTGGGVVEGRIGPEHGVVAGFAGRREARMRHRRGCVVVIGLVTTDACRVGDVVVVVDVAIRTLPGWREVRPSQHEAGAVVVERRIQPG